jgi:hypothetical protein
MSLRYEQYWSLKKTRDFLRWILLTPGRFTKAELRDKARRCLRHYPFLHETGQPMWSKDKFTDDIKAKNTDSDNNNL